jgi:uncharacterized membrane protein
MMDVVSALFDDRDHAAAAIHALKKEQFAGNQLSVVAKTDHAEAASHEHAVSGRDVRSGVWAGSALGAALSGYVAMSTVALVPALPLFVVGGAVIGGMFGSMTALGVAEKDERDTERTLREGGALVVVREPNEWRARRALEVLEENGARSAAIVHEAPETPLA